MENWLKRAKLHENDSMATLFSAKASDNFYLNHHTLLSANIQAAMQIAMKSSSLFRRQEDQLEWRVASWLVGFIGMFLPNQ